MINRINLILRAKNITARQFAEEIGIQPSGMSHILGGRNNPSLDFAVKVLRRYPEIDPGWLLLGRGEMWGASTKQPTTDAATATQNTTPTPSNGNTAASTETPFPTLFSAPAVSEASSPSLQPSATAATASNTTPNTAAAAVRTTPEATPNTAAAAVRTTPEATPNTVAAAIRTTPEATPNTAAAAIRTTPEETPSNATEPFSAIPDNAAGSFSAIPSTTTDSTNKFGGTSADRPDIFASIAASTSSDEAPSGSDALHNNQPNAIIFSNNSAVGLEKDTPTPHRTPAQPTALQDNQPRSQTTVAAVQSVLLLYTDGTFRTFHPAQQ